MHDIIFSGSPLDRAADRRTDDAWIAAQLRDRATIVIGLSPDGQALLRDGGLARLDIGLARKTEKRLFLGLWDDAAVFAVETESSGNAELTDARSAALALPREEAAIFGNAKSLFEWHRRHGFCSVCGMRTQLAAGGWKRDCASCSTEHFPRVDPVVIMLPVSKDRCLLGRNAAWPAGRMAALAGFVEPGESIEEACARELMEEAGLVSTGNITYLGSQPWPFPSSLIFGMLAEVEDETDAVADGVELEEVRWFNRNEARAVIEGKHPDVQSMSVLGIAHHLVVAWLATTD
ncbi:MAG TPA: NAD(+) diphosphatase [Thermoanaerobaculia bacterium]|jgi:NAD+ diphosphatase